MTDDFGTVGGGCSNRAGDDAGTTSDGPFDTVSGGVGNIANGGDAAVGGGLGNTANGFFATVGGGRSNTANGQYATVGGGVGNIASGAATVGGGDQNVASLNHATVGGGFANTAAGDHATVGGGGVNTAGGSYATVGGGLQNTANGFAGFAVGQETHADGDYSFAAGLRANAAQPGMFSWADSTPQTFGIGGAADTFNVRAVNGVWLWTSVDGNGNVTHSCRVTGPGNFNCDGAINGGSSRTLKHHFHGVSDAAVLAKLARLPVSTWSYKGDPSSVRHIGPMSEDFSKAFGLGDSTKAIDVMDEAGVSLAAIKALYGRSVLQAHTIDRLRGSVRSLRARLGTQGRQIATLQKEVKALLKASRP